MKDVRSSFDYFFLKKLEDINTAKPPISTEGQTTLASYKDDQTMSLLTKTRVMDPKEASHAEAIRRRPKNSKGQSLGSSVTPDKKEKGVQGFIFSPSAKPTAEEIATRAANLVEYKSEPAREVWVNMTWYQALFHRLMGGKVEHRVVDNENRWGRYE